MKKVISKKNGNIFSDNFYEEGVGGGMTSLFKRGEKRAKVNMTTKCSKNLRTTPHIDNANKHYVMIYYVNDSDGDTIIYKQKYGEKRLWLSPYKRVSPKAGRCVFFNGLHYHSASLPKKSDVRCVVNMNFID